MQYLKKTISLFIIIGGICSIGIIIWFNYPHTVIPEDIKIKNMTIRIEAYENINLNSYDQYEFKIDTKEKIDKLVELLNQYTCKRTSDFSKRMSVSQGIIEINVVPADEQKIARPFWIGITPGNELQNRRYESANTNFTYMIQPRKNCSLSQDLINYIDKNAATDYQK